MKTKQFESIYTNLGYFNFTRITTNDGWITFYADSDLGTCGIQLSTFDYIVLDRTETEIRKNKQNLTIYNR